MFERWHTYQCIDELVNWQKTASALTSDKERRDKVRIAVVDDQPFAPQQNLRNAGFRVIVDVHDKEDTIVMSVTSWGPCIADSERYRIFDSGFRGAAAERFKHQGGAGIGLYAASTIAKQHFGGKLDVRQGTIRKNVDGLNYYETAFLLELPIHEKIAEPVPRRRAPTHARRTFRRKHTRR